MFGASLACVAATLNCGTDKRPSDRDSETLDAADAATEEVAAETAPPEVAPEAAPELAPDAGVEPDAPEDEGTASDAAEDAATDAGDGATTEDAAGAEDARPDAASPDAGASDSAGPVCQTCPTYGNPTSLGALPAIIRELSGLAMSRRHNGILYAHNDSGDSARFFAINESASLMAEIDLQSVQAVDWEAIAVGPCPAGSCVYVADMGDNDVQRTDCAIYRVAETPVMPQDGSTIAVSYERFPFGYPDGPHNAETMLVDPNTGQIVIVTKERGISSGVYELPLPLTPNVKATLVRRATLSIGSSAGPITDGDFHPCGDRVLIRSNLYLYELARPAGGDFASLFTAAPRAMPLAAEAQGEAVAYSLDGRRYFTSSEAAGGSQPPLSAVTCTGP